MKRALWKFAEGAAAALGDAESEVQRTLIWLDSEQRSYWTGQIRKRQEAIVRAHEAVRQKKLFKDATGTRPSAIEEEKALAAAKRALEEAEKKLVNVKRWVPILQKELQIYKGSVQRFATAVQVDIPAAVNLLNNLLLKLEGYVALRAEVADAPAGPGTEGVEHLKGEGVDAQAARAPGAERVDAGKAEAETARAATVSETEAVEEVDGDAEKARGATVSGTVPGQVTRSAGMGKE
jgi:flavin-binding protein dodecin